MKKITINNKTITQDSPAYLIAEIGSNHCGSLDLCKEMFKVAKQCGADAVKLQKRDNKTLYTKAFFNSPYVNENSYGRTYGEHREALEFNMSEYLALQEYAKELDIDFFATAFDIPSVDFLTELGMPIIKIASGSLTNTSLIKYAFSTSNLIISTGGATIEDVDRVYDALDIKASFAFLHCIASYPNQPTDMNLKVIPRLMERYPHTIIGFSDHYNGIVMAEGAYILGARIIEKHFTLNHTFRGTDHALSLEPQGLETLCHNLKRLHEAVGNGEKRILPSEVIPISKMAQSCHLTQPMKAGEVLNDENCQLKSPAVGIPAYEYKNILGKPLIIDCSTSDILTEDKIG